MRAVVQRVSEAAVRTPAQPVRTIGQGLLVYLGVAADDEPGDAEYLARKVAGLRIFPDDEGRLNRSVVETGGEVLVISAFTTQGDARRGLRPSFDQAAGADKAEPLYRHFCELLVGAGCRVQQGWFGMSMAVSCINDGPVCVLLDSRKQF